MRNTIRAVVMVLAIAVAGPVSAGQLEDADAAIREKDYATALRLLQQLADQGDAHAQSNLGDMCWNGVGLPMDYTIAAEWYRKAADQGYGVAQFEPSSHV